MFLGFKWLRLLTFAGLACATAVWGAFGVRWSHAWTAEWGRPPLTEVERLTNEVAARDPKAGEQIQSLQARSDARALAASLVIADRRGGIDEVRKLAAAGPTGPKPPSLRLAELAIDSSLNLDREQRDGVLLAHGPAVEILSGANAEVTAYLDQLERASKDVSAWSLVRDDPVGLIVWMNVPERSLQDYYARERDWLAVALAESASDPSGLTRYLQVSKEFHPLVKQALVELDLGRVGFELFLEHGPLVQASVNAAKIPLDETLEIVFANRDLVVAKSNDHSPDQAAQWLASVRANKPNVWKYARTTPLALRLDAQASDVAERLLERFGADDVAAFLFAAYENEVSVAARAIDRFGDLAFYVLNRYHEDPRVHRLLADTSVGVRLVPYLAQFGDAGLDRVSANRGWLDKYFARDGTPLEKEWWTKIPGGGAADVARNWSTGKPNEWSELGWASLDVADAALLVASFGGSAVLTQGSKQAVKRAAISEARESALRLGQGARLAAREALVAGRSASMLRRAAGLSRSVVSSAGRTALRASENAASLVRNSASGWTRLSPTVRKWVARGLLGAGLYITLKERTLPMVAEKAGALMERIARQPLESLGEGLRSALASVGVDPNSLGTAVGIGLYAAVLGSLAAGTWLLRPRRRGVVYIG
jgi:hypothetical protein